MNPEEAAMSHVGAGPIAEPYEQQLDANPRWALMEGSKHFDEKSKVFVALEKITKRLADLGIPYAVVGGMALFKHGLRRFTEDVHILVSRESLNNIHANLVGLGYLPPHSKSKHLRDTELGIKIELLTTGDFPGDGKPKPVAFPDPTQVSVEINGTRCVTLEALVELKLASGVSNVNRLRDLADVQDLIRERKLSRAFGESLNPYVQPEYFRLWDGLQAGAAMNEDL
jgi:hypothetical protein